MDIKNLCLPSKGFLPCSKSHAQSADTFTRDVDDWAAVHFASLPWQFHADGERQIERHERLIGRWFAKQRDNRTGHEHAVNPPAWRRHCDQILGTEQACGYSFGKAL